MIMEALDPMKKTIACLKRKSYVPVSRDKMGVYLKNGPTKVYVDHIGIFVYRRYGSENSWVRESGHTFDLIPWDLL